MIIGRKDYNINLMEEYDKWLERRDNFLNNKSITKEQTLKGINELINYYNDNDNWKAEKNKQTICRIWYDYINYYLVGAKEGLKDITNNNVKRYISSKCNDYHNDEIKHKLKKIHDYHNELSKRKGLDTTLKQPNVNKKAIEDIQKIIELIDKNKKIDFRKNKKLEENLGKTMLNVNQQLDTLEKLVKQRKQPKNVKQKATEEIGSLLKDISKTKKEMELKDKLFETKQMLNEYKFNKAIENLNLKKSVSNNINQQFSQIDKIINSKKSNSNKVDNVMEIVQNIISSTKDDDLNLEELDYVKINSFYNNLDNLLKKKVSPYKYDEKINKVEKLIKDTIGKNTGEKVNINLKSLSKSIVEERYQNDFIPTPYECLKKFNDYVVGFNHYLEPTAGVGHMINYLYSMNDYQINMTAIEQNKDFSNLLKILYPNAIINPTSSNNQDGNFLYNNSFIQGTNDIDCVLMNPPYSYGGDSNFYFNFLFKALYILNKSSANVIKNLCIICPPLTKDKNKHPELTDVLKKIGPNKLHQILKSYIDFNDISLNNIKKYYKSNFDYENELHSILDDNFGWFQSEELGDCNKFITTGFNAKMYVLFVPKSNKK